MKFIDWFSGVGGFRLALERAGHECVASCEINDFCIKIQKERYGHEPQFKDITQVKAEDLPAADLWVGGFPCQDLSVAGKRGGLREASRSGLVWTLFDLAAVRRPRWCWLENVPGLLSSFKGSDFWMLLARMSDLWPAVGWRVLDAQFFGTPQRRRRVFIVGGPRADRVKSVLLEPQVSKGNSQTCGPKGKAASGIAGPDAQAAGGSTYSTDLDGSIRESEVAPTLLSTARNGPRGNQPASIVGVAPAYTVRPTTGWKGDQADNLVASPITASQGHHGHSSPRGDGRDNLIEHVPPIVSQAISAKWSKGSSGPAGDEHHNLIVPPTPIQDVRGGTRHNYDGDKDRQGMGIGKPVDPNFTLDTKSQHAIAINQPGREGGSSVEMSDEKAYALRAADGSKARQLVATQDKAAPVTAGSHAHGTHAPGRRKEDDENLVIQMPLFIDAYATRGSASPNQDPVKADGKGDPLDTTGPGAIAFQPGALHDVQAGPMSPTVKAGGTGSTPPAVAFDSHNNPKEHTGTLIGGEKGGGRNEINLPIVAAPITPSNLRQPDSSDRNAGPVNLVPFDETQITSDKNYSNPKAGDPSHPLAAGARPPTIASPMMVRRLTPSETERLQGFPDGITCTCGVRPDCPDRRIPEWIDPRTVKLSGCGHSACGCKCPDGPRYRAMGNSVAIPAVGFIAARFPLAELPVYAGALKYDPQMCHTADGRRLEEIPMESIDELGEPECAQEPLTCYKCEKELKPGDWVWQHKRFTDACTFHKEFRAQHRDFELIQLT